jgi:hypothetical protein
MASRLIQTADSVRQFDRGLSSSLAGGVARGACGGRVRRGDEFDPPCPPQPRRPGRVSLAPNVSAWHPDPVGVTPQCSPRSERECCRNRPGRQPCDRGDGIPPGGGLTIASTPMTSVTSAIHPRAARRRRSRSPPSYWRSWRTRPDTAALAPSGTSSRRRCSRRLEQRQPLAEIVSGTCGAGLSGWDRCICATIEIARGRRSLEVRSRCRRSEVEADADEPSTSASLGENGRSSRGRECWRSCAASRACGAARGAVASPPRGRASNDVV